MSDVQLMQFHTKLGYSFAVGGSGPKHQNTNMRSFCISIENDATYYDKFESDQTSSYLDSIEQRIEITLDYMEQADEKVKKALLASNVDIAFTEPYNTVKVVWSEERKATLLLMRVVQESDEIFAMLDLAKKVKLADGFKISQMRKPVINELTTLFSDLMTILRDAKKQRKGALYQLKL